MFAPAGVATVPVLLVRFSDSCRPRYEGRRPTDHFKPRFVVIPGTDVGHA